MKSIFELADFYEDRNGRTGCTLTPQAALHKAAMAAVEGYETLSEAAEEEGTRYDPYGNEIEPYVVYQAAQYLKTLPEWIGAQLRAVAERIDQRAADKVDTMPSAEHFDRAVDRLESESIRKRELLESASALVNAHFREGKV